MKKEKLTLTDTWNTGKEQPQKRRNRLLLILYREQVHGNQVGVKKAFGSGSGVCAFLKVAGLIKVWLRGVQSLHT